MLNWLLVGSLGLTGIALINDLVSLIVLRDSYILARLITVAGIMLFFGALLGLSRMGHRHTVSSVILVLTFFVAALWVVGIWGILTPTGVLLFSLVIVMAGILLGARASLYMAALTALSFSVLECAKANGYIHPDTAWQQQPSSFTDITGFTAIYATLALVTWLFNRQMEMSLTRAQRSEKALQRQKASLEVKVRQRTKQLEAARLEQMRELYRFAELGRLSTALFHDLANHLANISVDIEGLDDKGKSDIMQRMRGNVRHIDDVVQRVRQQIQGRSSVEAFNVIKEVNEVFDILAYDASQARVSIALEPGNVRTSLNYKGDLTRFRQVLMNLVSNAIEAYGGRQQGGGERTVVISLNRVRTALTIKVTNRGSVIPAAKLDKIFKPFYTTKPKGVGIGLFIVKQVVENDFDGSINVSSDRSQGTTFTISLPKSYYAKNGRD